MTLAPRVQKVRIFSYLSTHEQANKRYGARLKTDSELEIDEIRGCERLAPCACETLTLRSLNKTIWEKKGPFILQSIFLHILEPTRAWRSVALYERIAAIGTRWIGPLQLGETENGLESEIDKIRGSERLAPRACETMTLRFAAWKKQFEKKKDCLQCSLRRILEPARSWRTMTLCKMIFIFNRCNCHWRYNNAKPAMGRPAVA